MKLRRTYRFNPAFLTFVPFVNVLFLVLVFYTMTSKFILQPGVPIVLSPTSWVTGLQKNALIVSITGAPAPAIYFNDQRVTMELLQKYLDENQAADRSIILKVDSSAPSGVAHAVANEALLRGYTVLDAGEANQR